jgi:hypothetical protein
MVKPSRSLDARLLKAQIAMNDGRVSEGVEELREAVLDAVKLSPKSGLRQVEEILRFAKENDALDEVQEIFETEALRRHFFGPE